METSQSAVTAALLQSLFWGSPASFLQARIQKGSKLDRVSATEPILDCLGHTHTFTNTRTLSSLNNCKASQEAVAPPTARREVVAPPPALREAVPLAQPPPHAGSWACWGVTSPSPPGTLGQEGVRGETEDGLPDKFAPPQKLQVFKSFLSLGAHGGRLRARAGLG